MTDQEFLDTVTASVDARVSGNLLDAMALAGEACTERPDEPSAWHTFAMVASDLGHHADALLCRESAVSLLDKQAGIIQDSHREYVQQCIFGYACSLLLDGQWEKAWPFWEAGRLGYSWTPPFGTKYWQGEQGGSLLLVCEGGYGDLFCFSRFIPKLRHSYLGKIGLFVQRGLRRFRNWRALGVDQVYEIGDPVPSGQWQYSISLMSLPARLQCNRPSDIPADRLNLVQDRGEPHGIGFCWRSEENMTKRRFRSLTSADAQAIVSALSASHRLYSLSPSGRGLAAQDEFQQPAGLPYVPGAMKTWSATAEYIASMESVLTVDTAVAHLAGLLGVPTMLVLPLNVDWKWGLAGNKTAWYPSVRLFRNQDPLVWDRDGIVRAFEQMRKEVRR